MNRIRSIKPETRRNRKIADCGILATLLARELITYPDDQGRFRADVREVKAECLPYFDSLKLAEVEKAIQALAAPAVGYIELYEVDGERYGWVPGWFKDQLIKADRVTWSELPPPPSFQPQMMSKALYDRWLQDASNGDLPPRGDGSLVAPQGPQPVSKSEPLVSNLEPERRQVGDGPEASASKLEPRARRRAGADRTGPDRTGPERTGEDQDRNGARPEGTGPRAEPADAAVAAVRAARSLGTTTSPEVIELVQGYQELGYVQPSAADVVKAGEFVAELAYLTVAEMLERMRQHLAWCEQNGKPRPGGLGGFWNTLRRENDFRRDGGAKPREPSPSAVAEAAVGGVLRMLPGGAT